jgi:Secretion system C-terminal sorting domain/Bacterial Ig domain
MFSYFISDGNGGSDTATVTITVISVNDLPVIANLPDSVVFDADTSVTLSVWDVVEDVETPDSLLLFDFSANPDSLLFSFDNTTGFLTVSAEPNFSGEINVTMTVTDTNGGSAMDSLVVIVHPTVGINDPFDLQIPKKFVLMQNYPNPFNPVTNIRFGLPVASDVVIEVYNILGQRVIKLLDEHKPAGYHVVQFNASQFGSGLYFYRIKANNFNEVKKMFLVK